jgi:hypothetical protein
MGKGGRPRLKVNIRQTMLPTGGIEPPNMTAIARELGVSRQTVRRRLGEKGLLPTPLSREQEDPVHDWIYRYLGYEGCDSIGAAYGVAPRTVQRRLKSAGLRLRPAYGQAADPYPVGWVMPPAVLAVCVRRLESGDSSLRSLSRALAIPYTTLWGIIHWGISNSLPRTLMENPMTDQDMDAEISQLVVAHERLQALGPILVQFSDDVSDFASYGTEALPAVFASLRAKVEAGSYFVDELVADMQALSTAYTLNPVGAVALGSEAALGLTGAVMSVRRSLAQLGKEAVE